MAGPKSRKKKFVVRLELGARGLLATGVVCFCVLLWMFLLGIWAGDHLLTSAGVDDDLAPIARPLPLADRPAAVMSNTSSVSEPIVAPLPPAPILKPRRVERKELSPRAAKISYKKKRHAKTAPTRATSGGSFFTLQVGAYRKKPYAIGEVARLKARDLAAFYREPDPGRGKFIRVYIGRYPTMAAARSAGAAIEKDQGIKSFVTMIPGGAGRR